MYYFLTNQIAAQISGIEHAQVNRLRLFQDHHVPAKIFTNQFDRLLHHHARCQGIADHEIVNLFDWLQHTIDYHGSKTMIKDIDAPGNATESKQESGGTTVYFVNHHPVLKLLPFSFDSQQLNEVHYLDFAGNVIQKDLYDTRGFLSMSQFMDQNGGGVVTEICYTPDHIPACQIVYRRINSGFLVTRYRVFNYAGNDWYFDNMNQLIRFVLDELNLQDGKHPNTLMADMDYVYDHPLTWLTTPTRKFLVWHNIHTIDPFDLSSPLYASYQFELDHAAQFDGLIVASKQQARDIKDRFHPRLPIITLPFGSVNERQQAAPQIKLTDRYRYQIIAVARIHEQKNLGDTIKAFEIIHQTVPQATLDIWGYVNDQQLYQRLKQQVTQAHLDDYISFKGYQDDLQEVYNQAVLLMMTSRYEGFGLALVEALSHGVPVLSYDLHYGPAEIVDDGVNGALVPQGDYHQLAKRAITYLNDEELLSKLSQNAYGTRQQFSVQSAWQIWQDSIVIK